MGLLYVFDVDGVTPGSHIILVWINENSDRQLFDYNTKVRPQTRIPALLILAIFFVAARF